MNVNDELLPCPHCGCLAWLHSSRTAFIREPGKPEGHRIECEGTCHAMTCWWHSRVDAIDNWNMRTLNQPSKVSISVEDAEYLYASLSMTVDMTRHVGRNQPGLSKLQGTFERLSAAIKEAKQ